MPRGKQRFVRVLGGCGLEAGVLQMCGVAGVRIGQVVCVGGGGAVLGVNASRAELSQPKIRGSTCTARDGAGHEGGAGERPSQHRPRPCSQQLSSLQSTFVVYRHISTRQLLLPSLLQSQSQTHCAGVIAACSITRGWIYQTSHDATCSLPVIAPRLYICLRLSLRLSLPRNITSLHLSLPTAAFLTKL